MKIKNSFKFKPYLFLLLDGGSGNPYAVRLNLKEFYGWILTLTVVFVVTATGSLLFFREVELNRHLEERVLELEVRERLVRAIPIEPAAKETAPVYVSPSQPIPPIVSNPTDLQRETTSASPVAPPVTSTSSMVEARLSELSSERLAEEFNVKLGMVPTSTGVAQGELLVILETEIPRIGTANHAATVRKRYFIYPGYRTKEDLNQDDLSNLERKPFHFSRALQTTVHFRIGKLLKPLALNVYIFDKNRSLIHHERKVIETVENYGD